MPVYLPPKTIVAGSNISVADSSTSATVSVANVGSPNGIASLDGGGKVPVSQLPASIMEYKGTWDASTNTPTLADGTGDAGDTYRVSVGGTQNLGSGSITFDVGDYVIYNGTIWQKSDTTDAVASVNGLTGNVVLTTANIADSTDKRYITDAQQTVLTNTSGTNSGDQNVFSTIAVSGQSNVVADTTSDTVTLVAGAGIGITTDPTTDAVTITNTMTPINNYFGQGIKNILINPDFYIAQRIKPGTAVSFTSTGTYTNTDDTYNFDRWYLLSDGNNRVNITREVVDVPIACPSVCKMTAVATASPGYKFGQAQIIENINCASFTSYYACLSFSARVNNAFRLNDIRCAIVGWTGAADAVTSDIVASWGPINTNPTLVANAIYLNTPDNLYIPDSWATDGLGRNIRYTAVCSVPSTVKNIIVFIWSNSLSGHTIGDYLSIADVQLEADAGASSFERLPIELGTLRCLRYFWGLWARTASQPYNYVAGVSATRMDGNINYPSAMRIGPAITFSALSTLRVNYGGGAWVPTSITNVVPPTPTAWFYSIGYTTGGIVAGFAGIFGDNAVNTSWIHFNAEL